MFDPVDICNMALASLSVELIDSLTDTSTQAKLCDGLYPVCRDRLQATGYFDFVNQNLLLEDPAISPPPNWGYSHYFELPIDTLRVNSVSSAPETLRPTGWQQIGMVLATTFSPAYANLALREGRHARVDYAVMDEFHYYADRDRGIAWQIPLLELEDAACCG